MTKVKIVTKIKGIESKKIDSIKLGRAHLEQYRMLRIGYLACQAECQVISGSTKSKIASKEKLIERILSAKYVPQRVHCARESRGRQGAVKCPKQDDDSRCRGICAAGL